MPLQDLQGLFSRALPSVHGEECTKILKAYLFFFRAAFHLFPKGGLFIFVYDWRHIFLDWLNSQLKGRQIVCLNSPENAHSYCDF